MFDFRGKKVRYEKNIELFKNILGLNSKKCSRERDVFLESSILKHYNPYFDST